MSVDIDGSVPLDETRLADLTVLARAVAGDAAIVVVATAAGEGARVDPQARVIWISAEPHWPPEVSRALAIHEAGHLVVSFYLAFLAVEDDCQALPHTERQALAMLLNCLDDVRMERWLERRLPGCAPWLESASRLLAPPGRDADAAYVTLLRALIERHRLGREPQGLPGAVVDVLQATREAVLAYLGCQPPVLASADPAARAAYRESPAARCFHDDPHDIDGFGANCRLRSWEAFRIAVDHIWPRARDLLLADEAAGQPPPTPPPPRSGLREAPARQLPSMVDAYGRPDAGLPPGVVAPSEPRPQPVESYEDIVSEVAEPCRRLTALLETLFEPLGRSRLESGFSDGCRIDLRGAMAFEADRRRHVDIWMRRSLPVRRQEHVQLLCDLSGSMRDQKVRAMLRAVVMLVESLERCQLQFAVNGFQDRLIPLKRFGEPLGPPARAAIAEAPLEVTGRRPGGNNQPADNDDGYCVRQAGEELLGALAVAGVPTRAGIMIVLSDGVPSVRARSNRESEADLRAAVTWAGGRGLQLVGLGMGPNTGHVEDYYPVGKANVPVSELPEVLGSLVRTVLGTVHAGLA